MTADGLPPGIHRIRGLMGSCHLLVEEQEAWIVDTGLFGEPPRFRRLLAQLGLPPSAIRGILLTHGHLDHTNNLAALKEWTGAEVWGHPADQPHIDGVYPYRGVARVCGWLEATGRTMGRYRPVRIDQPFGDGDLLPAWGGLRVVHLPGHTDGHCGFYSERHDLLFAGDLFASFSFSTHLPPAILNSRPELIPGSLRKAAALGARLILPNHYQTFDGDLHRRRFETLCRRIFG